MPSARGQRIGIMGGTFDPPHVAHLAAAVEVASVLSLDRMLLVVAGEPWQKVGTRDISPSELRLEMVRAAVEGHPPLEASDIEVRREGPSYTADTLEQLRRLEPTAELFLVVGSDVAAELDTWHRPDLVRVRATTVVMDRAGTARGRPPAGWEHLLVEVPSLDISSSDLRRRVREGRPIDFLVPDPVVRCIRRHGLYLPETSPRQRPEQPSRR